MMAYSQSATPDQAQLTGRLLAAVDVDQVGLAAGGVGEWIARIRSDAADFVAKVEIATAIIAKLTTILF